MLSITNIGAETTSVLLDPTQSEALRLLLHKHINCKLSNYIRSVGLEPPNIYAVLSGRRKLTLQTLNKLLSGINLTVQCQIEFQIQTDGCPAQDAHYPSLEEQLSSEIGEELEEGQWTDQAIPSITNAELIRREKKD